MSFEDIEKKIQESSGLPFEMMNDTIMLAWDVAVADGDLFARRTAWLDGKDEDPCIDYYQVPYHSLDAKDGVCADDIYELIMEDFISCYGEDLYCGSAYGLSLFDMFAGADDEGLVWMLGVFMKSYAEFLQDAFLYFGEWLEEQLIIIEPGEPEEPRSPADLAQNKRARLVRNVLAHTTDATLTLLYDDDSAVHWEFANTHGMLWHHCASLYYVDDGMLEGRDEYGSFSVDDPDHWGGLRDVVFAQFAKGGVEQHTELGDPFGLIGINPEDLEDND